MLHTFDGGNKLTKRQIRVNTDNFPTPTDTCPEGMPIAPDGTRRCLASDYLKKLLMEVSNLGAEVDALRQEMATEDVPEKVADLEKRIKQTRNTRKLLGMIAWHDAEIEVGEELSSINISPEWEIWTPPQPEANDESSQHCVAADIITFYVMEPIVMPQRGSDRSRPGTVPPPGEKQTLQ